RCRSVRAVLPLGTGGTGAVDGDAGEASGRVLDLAVRLEVAGQSFQVCDTVDQAVQMAPPGRIEVIANYTAFQDLRRRIGN
ncbi:hypothetical protein ACWD6I_32390, partial [Streptomyces sp. NPDC002454]